MERFKTVKQFDDEITAPAFGHKDAAAYYAKESVVSRLGDIALPVAIVAGKGDPLIPMAMTRAALKDAPANITLFEVDGGHITMGLSMTMKQRAPDGLMPQSLAWIANQLPQ